MTENTVEVKTEDQKVEDVLSEYLPKEEEPEPEIAPYERSGKWFVLHTYSGHEKRVQENLNIRVKSMNVDEKVFETVIPMEDVAEFKNGKKTIVQKRIFPGYMLIRMSLDDDSWFAVRNTHGVTGFVGNGNKPNPLTRREVEKLLGKGEVADKEAPVEEKVLLSDVGYNVGQQVRVTNGPFTDFSGEISEIDAERAKIKVMVDIFGRETPVELEFGQVATI